MEASKSKDVAEKKPITTVLKEPFAAYSIYDMQPQCQSIFTMQSQKNVCTIFLKDTLSLSFGKFSSIGTL